MSLLFSPAAAGADDDDYDDIDIPNTGPRWGGVVWCGADDNFDEFSAETLAAIDNELQQIKLALLQRFPQLDLSSVFPIGQVCQQTC